MEQRIFRSLSVLVIIAILGGVISALVRIYPNLLWFQMVGYDAIYSKILFTRIFVGVIVGLIFLILTLGNLYLIWRLVGKMRLLTNNPRKISSLEGHALEVVERVPLQVKPQQFNQHYLETKRSKLGHLVLDLPLTSSCSG